MRKYGLYLMMLAAAIFCTTSCSDEEDNHQERWMIANQNAINAIKANSEYKELKSPGGEGSIYYKEIKKGHGTEPIYYTSRMECYYKGSFAADYPELNLKNGDVFDKLLFDDGSPFIILSGFMTLSRYSVINGWKVALQNMVEGDKWEVWVPHQLGYGREGNGNIPGYSTLVFEMEVVKVRGIDE